MSTCDEDASNKWQSANRRGGDAVVTKYGADHMRRIGAKGTAAVQSKYGLRFYSEIARRKRGSRRAGQDAA